MAVIIGGSDGQDVKLMRLLDVRVKAA